MKLDPYISELLYEHDCVIITDLGGFVASYKQASMNPALHVISPAAKKIAFNSSLRNNDGLLASYVSRKNALNYQQACEEIKTYVKNAIENLEVGQKVNIDKIGTLYLDSEKNIQFTPDNNVNFLIESFGLTPVHSPVIKKEIPEKITRQEIRKTERRKNKTRSTKLWRTLEVIPAAAVLTILFIVPPALNELNTNLGTMLPFSRINEYIREFKGEEVHKPTTIPFTSPFEVSPPAKSQPAPEPVSKANPEPVADKIVNEEPTKSSTDEVKNQPTTLTSAIPETTKVVKSEVTSDATSSEKSYHIIGGCFMLKENADKFVIQMQSQGMSPVIIGQNRAGLYMVSLFDASNLGEINSKLPEIKGRSLDGAWVYKQ